MTSETIDIITKVFGFVGASLGIIYLFCVIHSIYTDFETPIYEHTKRIINLEKRLHDIDGIEADKE